MLSLDGRNYSWWSFTLVQGWSLDWSCKSNIPLFTELSGSIFSTQSFKICDKSRMCAAFVDLKTVHDILTFKYVSKHLMHVASLIFLDKNVNRHSLALLLFATLCHSCSSSCGQATGVPQSWPTHGGDRTWLKGWCWETQRRPGSPSKWQDILQSGGCAHVSEAFLGKT